MCRSTGRTDYHVQAPPFRGGHCNPRGSLPAPGINIWVRRCRSKPPIGLGVRAAVFHLITLPGGGRRGTTGQGPSLLPSWTWRLRSLSGPGLHLPSTDSSGSETLVEWEGGPAFPRPQPTPSSLSQPPLSTMGWLAGVLSPRLAEHTTPGCSKLSCFSSFPWGCPRTPRPAAGGGAPRMGGSPWRRVGRWSPQLLPGSE